MAEKAAKRRVYYAKNDFKRFMGYEESDYLMVAGFYNSCEQSKKSKTFNHVLVKGADYVAEKLGWLDELGQPDVKRAQNAIYRATKTEGGNGLKYLYSVSNKNHCITKSGGSRVYMSAPRWLQYQSELSLATVSNGEDEVAKELLDKLVAQAKDTLLEHGITTYEDSTLILQVRKLLTKQHPSTIQEYFDYLVSRQYWYQREHRKECPRIRYVYDLYNKFDQVRSFKNDPDRHFDPTKELSRY